VQAQIADTKLDVHRCHIAAARTSKFQIYGVTFRRTLADIECAATISQSRKTPSQRGYAFHFQISNGGSRKACTVRVQAPSHQDAAEYCPKNWLTIESMARNSLAKSPAGRGTVQIDLP